MTTTTAEAAEIAVSAQADRATFHQEDRPSRREPHPRNQGLERPHGVLALSHHAPAINPQKLIPAGTEQHVPDERVARIET